MEVVLLVEHTAQISAAESMADDECQARPAKRQKGVRPGDPIR